MPEKYLEALQQLRPGKLEPLPNAEELESKLTPARQRDVRRAGYSLKEALCAYLSLKGSDPNFVRELEALIVDKTNEATRKLAQAEDTEDANKKKRG
ncbi:MAG: hypothetical protein ABII02_04695 [Candidatus Magasanikbacteria bacterium]